MKIFRSILLVFAFFVFGVGASVFNFLLFPVVKIFFSSDKYINFSSNIIHKTWRFFVGFMEFIGLIKVKIKNPEKLKEIKNKIIVATHPSFIDVVILIALIPRSTCFVKNILTKNFLMKNLVNSIFIPNDITIEDLKNQTKKYLDNDFNVIVFPMGNRHRENEHPKIKKGASLCALNANKNIIPIKITTSEDFLFANQPFYFAGKKRVDFLIEIKEEIELSKFDNPNEILSKRNITDEISKLLYN